MITVHVTCIIITECANNKLKIYQGEPVNENVGEKEKERLFST